MNRPKPTKRQQEQWDELVKDLPVYNPCPKCMQLQSDLRKLVEEYKWLYHEGELLRALYLKLDKLLGGDAIEQDK